MSKCRYQLRLKVEDHGCSAFNASGEAEDQDELRRTLAFKIATMFRILNDPPCTEDLAEVLETSLYSAFGLLAFLHRHWDGSNSIEDALHLIVDVDKLLEDGDEKEKDLIRHFLRQCSWAEEKSKS